MKPAVTQFIHRSIISRQGARAISASRSISHLGIDLRPARGPSDLNPQRYLSTTRHPSDKMFMTMPSEHMQPLTANKSAAVALYDQALWQYTCLSGDPVGLLTRALAADPTLVSAHIMNAAMHLLSTAVGAEHPVVVTSLAAIRDAADAQHMTCRERALACAVEALAAGQWRRAAALLEQQIAHSPCDLLSLRMCHDIYFFLGDSRNLRDGIARSWPEWDPSMPGYGRVAGMLAFGHEECGAYAQAEELAMTAVNMDPSDAWALHAVVHVYEMQGRREDGKRVMKEMEDHWKKANLFDAHLHWHSALMALEDGAVGYRSTRGTYAEALGQPSRVQALELVDAAALLWRQELLTADYEVPVAWVKEKGEVTQTLQLHLHPVLPADAPPPHRDMSVTFAMSQYGESPEEGGGKQGLGTGREGVAQGKGSAPRSFLSSLFGTEPMPMPVPETQPQPHEPGLMSAQQALHVPSRWEEIADRCMPLLRIEGMGAQGRAAGEEVNKDAPRYNRLNAFNDIHSSMTLAWATRSAAARGDDTSASHYGRTLDAVLGSMRQDAEKVAREKENAQFTMSQHGNEALGVYTVPLGTGATITLSRWAVHDNAAVNAAVGATMAEAMAAFVQQDYPTAMALLMRSRSRWHLAGGSHAQRDVFEQTLLHAAVGAGDIRTALSLARERCSVRPNSGQAWHMLAKLYDWMASIAEAGESAQEGSDSELASRALCTAASAPGQVSTGGDLRKRAMDARNRAYVLGINQGAAY